MTARLLDMHAGTTLVVGGEQYHIARRIEMTVPCPRDHALVALETAAGVWFVFCGACSHAELAGPDILDTLRAVNFAPPPARATVSQPALIGPGPETS